MNNNSQQKTLALYSKNRYQNKTSATTLAPNSSTHLRHNSNLGGKLQMASEKVTAMIEEVKALSVLELAELVHALEETFGVSAAAAAAPAAAAAAAPVEEKTEFDVVMTEFGAEKIKVIKEVRGLLGLGLAEAKALVEGVPAKLKEAVSKEEGEEIKSKLEAVGAKVELK